MVRTWDGTDEKGEQARIVYYDEFSKPYQLSVSSATGMYGTLRGAKSECAKYTGTKWKWKEVELP